MASLNTYEPMTQASLGMAFVGIIAAIPEFGKQDNA